MLIALLLAVAVYGIIAFACLTVLVFLIRRAPSDRELWPTMSEADRSRLL